MYICRPLKVWKELSEGRGDIASDDAINVIYKIEEISDVKIIEPIGEVEKNWNGG